MPWRIRKPRSREKRHRAQTTLRHARERAQATGELITLAEMGDGDGGERIQLCPDGTLHRQRFTLLEDGTELLHGEPEPVTEEAWLQLAERIYSDESPT